MEVPKSSAEVSDIYTEIVNQLKIQKNQNNMLLQNTEDLMQQFFESRNNLFNYFKEKPKNDIIIVTDKMEESVKKTKNDWKLDTKNYYNFAFVGYSKSGKSSLINAIRGINDNNFDAAKVGVTESTTTINSYTFADPQMKHVKFWDIPGPGVDDLMNDVDLSFCGFDCVLFCCDGILNRDQIELAFRFLNKNQPIAFVVSSFDIILKNAKKMKKVEKIDQNAVVACINNMTEFYYKRIKDAYSFLATEILCFFISAITLMIL